MITKNAEQAVLETRPEERGDAPRVDVHSSGGQLQTMDDPYRHTGTAQHGKHTR